MPPPPVEFAVLATLPGRLFVLSSILLALLFVVRLFAPLPELLEIFRKVVSAAFFGSLGWLAILAVIHNRRQLLWRVRQKLILSYVFLGVVPVVLVAAFALAGGWVLYINVAAYMFHDGFDEVREDIRQFAETSAVEIGRAPGSAGPALARKFENLKAQYPLLSLALVAAAPAAAPGSDGDAAAPQAPVTVSGPWRHDRPPAVAPAWLARRSGSFSGVVPLVSTAQPDDWTLVIRTLAPTPGGSHYVVADLPVDTDIAARIEDRTQTRIGSVSVPVECGGGTGPTRAGPAVGMLSLFRRTVAFMDCTNWSTGDSGRLAVSLEAPLGRLYDRLASAQSGGTSGASTTTAFLPVLAVIGVLLLIFQGSFLFMGAALARSITYAVHELFVGTERVQQGDFTHRIHIESRDQLGALAGSYNRMSASIEHLLHVQREKQRLDDELRIARDIQKSLLPIEPPRMAGLEVADLCEPAREVGGDYYDFFELGPARLGVMVADVSGKGTSAALYMAELKGLMLALSHTERSPRRLLVEVNRLLSAHLDNRSFITMTYAVIDLDARTLTCARAGHTPLVVVSGGASEVLTPSGMVLGLRLPGASQRFEQILEEHTRPLLPGDVIVLYTDGITEAMNEEGGLFGDAALAHVVTAQQGLDPAGIRERVVREVRAFVGRAEPHDDMTMIVLKIGEPPAGAGSA